MIKRDFIQRVVPNRTSDSAGGSTIEYEEFEKVDAHVSVATKAAANQYGLSSETLLEVITNQELTRNVNDRYRWCGKLFQLLRQVKSGNEWVSTLQEVTN